MENNSSVSGPESLPPQEQVLYEYAQFVQSSLEAVAQGRPELIIGYAQSFLDKNATFIPKELADSVQEKRLEALRRQAENQ